jgi:hypothetical protein
MQADNDAEVRRDDLIQAVRRVSNHGRGTPRGSITFRPGDAGALAVESDFGAVVPIPADGKWTAHVAVTAQTINALLRAKMPPRLRLTFYGERIMVGPTSILARDHTPKPPPFELQPPPEAKPPRRRKVKPPPIPKRPMMPDRW